MSAYEPLAVAMLRTNAPSFSFSKVMIGSIDPWAESPIPVCVQGMVRIRVLPCVQSIECVCICVCMCVYVYLCVCVCVYMCLCVCVSNELAQQLKVAKISAASLSNWFQANHWYNLTMPNDHRESACKRVHRAKKKLELLLQRYRRTCETNTTNHFSFPRSALSPFALWA